MERNILNYLIEWKSQKQPLPLIIRGARQVGKTYAVQSFGKDNFEDVVTINFEYSDKFSRCFEEDLDPKRIIADLEILVGSRIVAGKTLLFFDEIQHSPKAITALRYFKEELPLQHVIAAGSLLEFILDGENFSFPVGRVQFLRMHPMTFTEYLSATGNVIINDHLKKVEIDQSIDGAVHDRIMKFVHDFLYVGGMPGVVQTFINTQSFIECQRSQMTLLQTYQNDFSKYAKKSQYKQLRMLFEKAPELVGKHFKYSKVDPTVHPRDIKLALDNLCYSGLVTKVHHTTANGLPLRTQINEKKFKLLLLDVGLMQCALQTPYVMDSKEILGIHHGAVAEQFCGQELLALNDPYKDSRIHFWEREKKGSSAEVDYVCNIDGRIIPIEVKAGATGRLRSLRQFMEEKGAKIGVRISESPMTLEKGILSIPFYLIDQLPRLLKTWRSTHQ